MKVLEKLLNAMAAMQSSHAVLALGASCSRGKSPCVPLPSNQKTPYRLLFIVLAGGERVNGEDTKKCWQCRQHVARYCCEAVDSTLTRPAVGQRRCSCSVPQPIQRRVYIRKPQEKKLAVMSPLALLALQTADPEGLP